MEVMEVDGGDPAGCLNLIRVVRTLDDDASLTFPERIHKVWLVLSSTKSTRLHGVEEAILRWLLKQIGGKTEDAEHVRRYPLTWTVLSHVFVKIPAQVLGRALAHSKFVALLLRTLDEVTKPQESVAGEDDRDASKKRKRDNVFPSASPELRTPEGCIKSGVQIFVALQSLLDSANNATSTTSPGERVGNEHLKSIFFSSADQTRDITARLLLVCERSLSVIEDGLNQCQASWIDIVITLWKLRLYNKDDSLEFARYLYGPTCAIIAKLKGASGAAMPGNANIKEIWIKQLERFLSLSCISPARQRFDAGGSVETLSLALTHAGRSPAASTSVMWDIVARMPRQLSDPKSKAQHTLWARNVFALFLDKLSSMQPRDRNNVLSILLNTALQTGSVPEPATLRTICRTQALTDDGTDWTLLSKIIACDADTFLLDDLLLGDVFDRISLISGHHFEEREIVVNNVILPLQDAFVKARDLAGFVRRWSDRLGKNAEPSIAEPIDQTIWFTPEIRQHLADNLQGSLSNTQLLRLLQLLDSEDAKYDTNLVILDAISAGINSEAVLDTIDSQLFSMTIQGKVFDHLPPEIKALRWRIAGHMTSWETVEQCYRLWNEVKSDMPRLLGSGPLRNPDTFEAFTLCCKLCLANHIGGEHEAEITDLVCFFLERLVSASGRYDDILSHQRYVAFAFRHLPRLGDLPKQGLSRISHLLLALFWQIGQNLARKDPESLPKILGPLLHNFDVEDQEHFLNALTSHPLAALEDSTNSHFSWDKAESSSMALVLLQFPPEVWTKELRKQMMSSWVRLSSENIDQIRQLDNAKISEQSNVHSPRHLIILLRLLITVLRQPTFYKDMKYDDIGIIGSHIEKWDETALNLYETLYTLSFRQVITAKDDALESYLKGASEYVECLDNRAFWAEIIFLKTLLTALGRSPGVPWNVIEIEGVVSKLEQLIIYHFKVNVCGLKDPEHMLISEDYKVETTIRVLLGAEEAIHEAEPLRNNITLSGDVIDYLEARAAHYVSTKDDDIAWTLRSFLIRTFPDRYKPEKFYSMLEQASDTTDEALILKFASAFVENKSSSAWEESLRWLLYEGDIATGSAGHLLAARCFIEIHSAANPASRRTDPEGLDFGSIHQQLASLLTRSERLVHFRRITEILLFLLDKRGSSMTQFNIEITLNSVIQACSATGPKIQGPKAAGEIYQLLYKLVAIIIKQHRIRIRGHFPILLNALKALLTTLLVDPKEALLSTYRRSTKLYPPWLDTRLRARHTERFARLLTLICEPSAASVTRTRSRTNELDSATDAAKRAAGQEMYMVVEMYIKLQLENNVPRDIRKALEIGIYSVLNITSPGGRRVLNESLDASGRAVFKQMWADYQKFGKWSGV